MTGLQPAELRTNILSGITVSLALVPEAIAFALVAQVSPLTGLYAAFFLCLITALLGGCSGMISGAIGALAVVMVSLVVQHGAEYLRTVIRHHTSGQMKVAPEHSDAAVLEAMGKPGMESLLRFREQFNRMTAEEGLAQFLTYYMIAGHPACTLDSMEALRRFCRRELKLLPRQVQLFTPSPSTWSTLMYHTGINPFTGSPCFCEKNPAARERQKAVLTGTMAPKASPPVHQPPKTNKPRRRKH